MTSDPKRIHADSTGQIGPWDRTQTLKLTFLNGTTPLFGVAATNQNAGLSTHTQNTEYWAYSDLSSLASTATLTMIIESAELDDALIDRFLASFTSQLPPWTQNAPPWSTTTYSYISGRTPYLFKMTDPDSAAGGNVMGLSLVLTSRFHLGGVGWHKTFSPPSPYYNWQRAPTPGVPTTWSLVGATNDPGAALPVPGTSWWNVFQEILLAGSSAD